MYAETLVNTLAQIVAEFEVNTLGATFWTLQPESPVKTLPEACRGGFRDSLQDTEQLKFKALVHRQAGSIRQLKAITYRDTLGD